MNKLYLPALMMITLAYTAAAQTAKLAAGPALLFSNTRSRLTAAQKGQIYAMLGFELSKDKKKFADKDDKDNEYPYSAAVYITDLNKDGKEEVFVSYGNTYTSGMAGSSIVLFIPDHTGIYRKNLDFPGMVELMPATTMGYTDLVIGGPGFTFPVWKWNGTEYRPGGKISDNALRKIKTKRLKEGSMSNNEQ